jgi:hypothetical protein
MPGLKMDPDTGSLVELLHPVISASSIAPWRVRTIESGREFTVYVDELQPG